MSLKWFTFFAILLPAALQAEAPATIFDTSHQLALYSRPLETLNPKERRRMKLYGLRSASLDAKVWATLRSDRVDSRNLIAIRPYYLRASEDPQFSLEDFRVRFAFSPRGESRMLVSPHDSTPMFDISFGGEFEYGLPAQPIRTNRTYFVRFSAHPEFPSGFYYRSHDESILLVKADLGLKTGTKYNFLLRMKRGGAVLERDEQVVAELSGAKAARGLVAVTTAWVPVQFDELKVRGKTIENWRPVIRTFEGMLDLAAVTPETSEP